MRVTKNKNGLTLKAYAGTSGVLLAFNVTADLQKGLLGFSIERKPAVGKWEWMTGMLPFPGMQHDPGSPIPTDKAPVQKFRWSDYRVYPEMKYSYRLHAMYGTPAKPELLQGPELTVTTSSSDKSGEHSVVFNRAAGASQAFARKFKNSVDLMEEKRKHGGFSDLTVDDLEKVDPGVKDWLSRGLLAQITGIIGEAKDAKWALDIAIYEYEWHEIVQAVKEAVARGVQVRLLYHSKKGDKQTLENEHEAQELITAGHARPRKTHAIFHNKFIILSKVTGTGTQQKRKPQVLLCGSTNFTHNGIFRQANVTHTIRKAKGQTVNATAGQYLALFEALWENPESVPATKKWIDANNPIDSAAPLFAGFSPRSKKLDLQHFVKLIESAQSDLLFATAFVLPADIIAALIGKPNDPVLRLGVQNTDSNKIAGFHRDRTAQFAATAMLDHGFEGWLAESGIVGRGNILIHTKAVVVDFTSDSPTIISGSHNLSNPASEKNDENYLVIQGNTDLADSYGVEIMRIYDHYRARWVAQQIAENKLVAGGKLAGTDSWTKRYFKKDSLHHRDRLRFSGPA